MWLWNNGGSKLNLGNNAIAEDKLSQTIQNDRLPKPPESFHFRFASIITTYCELRSRNVKVSKLRHRLGRLIYQVLSSTLNYGSPRHIDVFIGVCQISNLFNVFIRLLFGFYGLALP